MALFGFTHLSATPSSPTSTLSIQVEVPTGGLEWPTAPFTLLVRRPGVRPRGSTAEAVTVGSYTAGGAVTLSARAVLAGGTQTVARSLKRGDECYPLAGNTIPFYVDGISYALTFAGIRAAIAVALAAGGGHVVVEGGHGAIVHDGTPITPASDVWLEIEKGTWLESTGSTSKTTLGFSGSGATAGEAFSGAVLAGANTGTLASGTNSVAAAADDICYLEKGGLQWQLMEVASVTAGGVFKFYDSFAWPYTAAVNVWTLVRMTTPLKNFKFSGEIRNNGNTGTTSTAIAITGFKNLDLSDAVITGFTAAASQQGITLTKGYGLTMRNVRLEQCGNYNATAGLDLLSVSKFVMDNVTVNNLTAQPAQFTLCTHGEVKNFYFAGGGRADEIDQSRRVTFTDGIINGNNTAADDGIAVESQALLANFNTAYLYFTRVMVFNCAGIGLNLFGDGSGPVYYDKCVFARNGTDIIASAGDLATYLIDCEYTTITNSSSNLYISTKKQSSYTPSLTQSGAATVTWDVAEYTFRDNMVKVILKGSVTAAGGAVGNNAMVVSLPVNAVAAHHTAEAIVGSGMFKSAAGNYYPFLAKLTAAAGFVSLVDAALPAIAVLLGQTGSSYNVAFANGDGVTLSVEYRRV